MRARGAFRLRPFSWFVLFLSALFLGGFCGLWLIQSIGRYSAHDLFLVAGYFASLFFAVVIPVSILFSFIVWIFKLERRGEWILGILFIIVSPIGAIAGAIATIGIYGTVMNPKWGMCRTYSESELHDAIVNGLDVNAKCCRDTMLFNCGLMTSEQLNWTLIDHSLAEHDVEGARRLWKAGAVPNMQLCKLHEGKTDQFSLDVREFCETVLSGTARGGS